MPAPLGVGSEAFFDQGAPCRHRSEPAACPANSLLLESRHPTDEGSAWCLQLLPRYRNCPSRGSMDLNPVRLWTLWPLKTSGWRAAFPSFPGLTADRFRRGTQVTNGCPLRS